MKTLNQILWISLPVLLAFTLSVSAETGSEIENYGVESHFLSNGLKILTLEDHSAPVVSFQMWVHTGSRNEYPGITGISHLFEHMMFKGSKKYGPEEHANLVKKHGGVLNAFTTNDVTVYFENIVSDKLELVVSLEAERLANLALIPETLASEREVVKEERRYRTDNDNFGKLFEQLIATAFTAHPYGWPVLGWMSDIDAITLEDCKEYHRLYYAPNNVIIVLTGDFNTEEAVAVIDKYFGAIPAQEKPSEIVTAEPEQGGERIVYVEREARLPVLMAGYHIPPIGHPDIYPLQVLQKIMSDGQSSRLYQKLVYQEQLAIFAGGMVDDCEDPGLFFLWLGVNTGRTMDEAKEMLFAEIDRFTNEPVSERELQKAKNQLEADFIFRLQTNMYKGLQLGDYEVRAGDYRMLFEADQYYRDVTAEDVMRVAGQYLKPSNRTSAILVPIKG
ncbi:insulinase family protein [bacterium]|nr:insulinase family protein [bacterium]